MSELLTRINRYFARQNKWTIWLLGLMGIMAVGAVDFSTNTHLTWLVFYIVPSCVVGWYTGRKPAMAIATMGGLLWYADKIIHPSSFENNGWVLFWNFSMRLGVFNVCGYGLSGMPRCALNGANAIANATHNPTM